MSVHCHTGSYSLDSYASKYRNRFWRDHSKFMVEQDTHVEASRSLLQSYTSAVSTLEKLQKTNVYADVFNIGHDGGLATINGLRFGRLPAVQVEWSEINAAWGCTLLLLKTIARKLECTISGYRLIPMGSFSKIEKLGGQDDKSSTLELYVSPHSRATSATDHHLVASDRATGLWVVYYRIDDSTAQW